MKPINAWDKEHVKSRPTADVKCKLNPR